MPKGISKIKLPTVQQIEKVVKVCIDKWNSLSPEDQKRLEELFQKVIDQIRGK
jgi:uncharacterized protein (UPF0216 family)